MHSSVKQEALLATLIGLATLLLASAGIKQFTSLNAVLWLLVANCLWLFMCWHLWQRLELNRASESITPYPTLGWANCLTLVRGGLIALTGGFLFQHQPLGIAAWIPGVLYAVAALLDRMDGFVARRTQHTSLLGCELDTHYDALGLIVAPLLAWTYAKVHWSFLLVSIAYYVFQWGLHWRRRHQLPVYPLLPSTLRRTLAGFQMGCVALILLPCFNAPYTFAVGIAFTLPILFGFINDWLVVSGRIISSVKSQVFYQRLADISSTIFQPLLRVMLSVSLLILFYYGHLHLTSVLAISVIIAGLMVLLGAASRLGAGVILLLLGWQQGDANIQLLSAIIIFASAALMLLGSGRFSLWRWDDRWVNRRDGEESS
jgi:CDP-diacylglycerol---glycerol-3-phosphate 3-phosphatidyltransferase